MSTGPRAARVLEGISVMDLHHGPEWVWEVDPGVLHIDLYAACVVGQVHQCINRHSYLEALHRIEVGGTQDQAAAGFLGESRRDDAVLNRLWSFAIRRLREQRPREVAA